MEEAELMKEARVDVLDMVDFLTNL